MSISINHTQSKVMLVADDHIVRAKLEHFLFRQNYDAGTVADRQASIAVLSETKLRKPGLFNIIPPFADGFRKTAV